MGRHSGCREHPAMIDGDVRHLPEYVGACHDMSDGCGDAMADGDHRLFRADPGGADRRQEAQERKEREHVEGGRHQDAEGMARIRGGRPMTYYVATFADLTQPLVRGRFRDLLCECARQIAERHKTAAHIYEQDESGRLTFLRTEDAA